MNKTIIPTVLAALALFAPALSPAQTPSCSSDEKSHQFDFWIGDWEVTAGGKVAGHNRIIPILNGCVIQENWTGASGSAGTSLNFYNPQSDEWEQFWVWRNGTTIYTKGAYSDGKMVLQGKSMTQNGQEVLNRITWFDNDDGTVRQYWQVSTDEGQTWSDAFDGLYGKR